MPPITILYNTSEMHKAIAEAIQATWHEAFGADVRLQNQETKVFLANREAGKYQVARASWVADYGDPQNFLEVFSAEIMIASTIMKIIMSLLHESVAHLIVQNGMR